MKLKAIILLFFVIFGSKAIAQVPTASIVVPSGTLCSGKDYLFTGVHTNTPTSFSWSVSPTVSVTINANNDLARIYFPRAGTYVVSLLVSNSSGSNIATATVQVSQSAKASFNASLTTVGFPNSLVLTNYSKNQIGNYWLYSDASKDSSLNAVKNYSASGNYTVKLVAVGVKGCNDTASYSFHLADSSGITLPNVFTPNNDGANDVFKPIARGIKTLNAWVYNRYGTFIYSWDTINGYWDGHTTSGEECQPDVYFCIIEATGFDGKAYKLKTNFTLLR